MNKHRALLSRPFPPCSDDDDCAAPLPLLQRWNSEWEGTFDECPAPPSCSLRRWASETCGTASNKSAALMLPGAELELDEEKPAPFPRGWSDGLWNHWQQFLWMNLVLPHQCLDLKDVFLKATTHSQLVIKVQESTGREANICSI
jgi:hypothetical protein